MIGHSVQEVFDLTEHEEMDVFLREIQHKIEQDQSGIIRRLEESHRKVESLKREKQLIETKLADNISFFNPSCAMNREKLENTEHGIEREQKISEDLKSELAISRRKALTMDKIFAFMKEHSPVEEEEIEEDNFTTSGISILEAQEMERKRIARDLHDSTVQSLTNIVHKTEYCSKMIDKDIDKVRLELGTMMKSIRASIDDMRRIIYDLRPMSIDDLGLVPTIQRFVNTNKEEHQEIEFQIKVTSESDEVDIPAVVTLTVFRIIQESCNNIFKYSQAKNVVIEINYYEDELEVSIVDDGIGFDKSQIGKGNNTNSGFGLSIMQERAQLLRGTFSITSEIGKGTKVSISIPYSVISEMPKEKLIDLIKQLLQNGQNKYILNVDKQSPTSEEQRRRREIA